MNFRTLLLAIAYILTTQVFAQKTSPYICNYQLPDSLQQDVWSIEQSQSGLLFLAGSRGILQFDGSEWHKITVPGLPTTLKSSALGDFVWVGCKNEFGILQKNSFGSWKYSYLYGKETDNFSIENIVETPQTVYFIGYNQIFAVDAASKKITTNLKTSQQITASFSINKQLQVYTESIGLQEFKSGKLETLAFNLTNDAVITSCTLGNNVLFGLASNKLLIYNGKSAVPFASEIESFLKENILHDIAIDKENNLIVSTLIGGIAVLDSKSGAIKHVMNYYNGLPDNEIYALRIDQNNGIWLAHEKGISRIDLSVPAQKFDVFNGLSGTILATAKYGNTLYVATSEGVYYLSQTEIVREIEIAKPVEEISYQTVTKEVEKTSRSFLLFHKREKVEQTETQKVKKIVFEKQKIQKRELGAWVYKKIDGISGKCKQMVATGYGLLAASNNGVYEIKGTQAKMILSGKYISQIVSSEFHAHYFCLSDDGVYLLRSNNDNWSSKRIFSQINQKISSLAEVDDNTIWLTGTNQAFMVNCSKDTTIKKFTVGTHFYPEVTIGVMQKRPIFIADNDVFTWNGSSIIPYQTTHPIERCIVSGLAVWIKQNGVWIGYEGTKQDTCNWIGLFNNIKSLFTDADGYIWLVDGSKGLYRINKKLDSKQNPLSIFITSQKTGNTQMLPLGEIVLPEKSNNLSLSFSSPSFSQAQVEYQYFIDGLSQEWSDWQEANYLHLNFLPHGSYTIHLRARNSIGAISPETTVSFTVPTPFTQSIWFYILILIAFTVLGFIIFKWRVRALQRDKDILEAKVRERTKTIEDQKEEISTQLEEIRQNKEEIEAQRDEIEAQRDTIIDQKEEIVQSITYARRIQHAVMPTGSWLKTFFTDHFILYQPRDIVSGDFYWMVHIGNKVIIAASDCTGHGVPGAFMSMLGVSFMNEIVLKNQLTQSNEIANQLRQTVIDTLSQTEDNQQAKDGMDMALCVFDFDSRTVQFTGAYNPLLLVRKGEIMEFAANRMPIGRYEKTDPFTAELIPFEKGDQFYLFSDGFEDQFGGEAQKKFKKVRFKEWLLQNSGVTLPQQKAQLHKNFEQWKGLNPQTDDVLVIGLKI